MWQEYQSDVMKQVASRSSQVMVAFTFWDPSALKSEERRGLYELRSYTLKVNGIVLLVLLLYYCRLEHLLNGDILGMRV